jgi:hypothetical protein
MRCNAFAVQRGAHHDESKVGPLALKPQYQGQAEVGIKVSLVKFVKNDAIDPG